MENEILDDVQIAQRALGQAKAKAAEIQQLKLQQLKTQVAEREAQAIKERQAAEDEYKAKIAVHAKRNQEKKDAELAERRKKETEERFLQAEIDHIELESKAKADKEAFAQKIADEAFRLEEQNKRDEADLLRGAQVKTEAPPITLQTPSHPLFRIFNPEGAPVAVQQASVVTQAVVEPPTLRTDDPQEQRSLISVFKNIAGVNLTALDAKNLLLRFQPSDIEKTVEYLALFSSRDNFVRRVEEFMFTPQITGGA